ncbi:thioredoxin reductase [Kickxella alabastrina]|uniref:Thioredoxin reductase n=1 Tax=Kickxella alabastrina TaxID=61397 RepID=A0ACC1I9P2_9FUNG|nr:thioredoxin reductase [Kickxella alabastrina]
MGSTLSSPSYSHSADTLKSPDMVNATQLVKSLIAKNAVMVFSKSYCPYCTKAKNLLKSNGINFEAIELDRRDDGSVIQSVLANLTNQRTVPNIFANGHHIGGCDNTIAALSNGSFKKILKGDKGTLFIVDSDAPEQSSSASASAGKASAPESPVSAKSASASEAPEAPESPLSAKAQL